MRYNDDADLSDNTINKVAAAFKEKIHTVSVEDEKNVRSNNILSDIDWNDAKKIKEAIELGLSFLEELLKFSNQINAINKIKPKIQESVTKYKEQINLLAGISNLAVNPRRPHWGGSFNRCCNDFTNSEFILLWLLLNQMINSNNPATVSKLSQWGIDHVETLQLVHSLV